MTPTTASRRKARNRISDILESSGSPTQMANGIRSFPPRSYGLFPQGVKWLLISNIALFVLYYLLCSGGLRRFLGTIRARSR